MKKRTIDTIPELNEKTRKILDTFSKSRTLAASLVKRSKIILMASQGISNQKISAKIGLHYDNVATWRNRFLKNLQKLNELENSAPEKLSDEIVRILSDKKRSGTPPKFTPEQIMQIISLACKDPKEYGYEVSHWNLPLLAKEVVKSGIAEKISPASVDRFLKSG